MNDDLKLCYVDGSCAWFTTQDISQQWGDDWNDAPYECNAGVPYEWHVGSDVPEYHLHHVYFESPLTTPADNNIPLSVEQINAGAQPWLQTDKWALTSFPRVEITRIYAGTSYPDFVRLIESMGGTVYVPRPLP